MCLTCTPFLCKIKLILTWKVWHEDLFWGRSKRQLGNGLLPKSCLQMPKSYLQLSKGVKSGRYKVKRVPEPLSDLLLLWWCPTEEKQRSCMISSIAWRVPGSKPVPLCRAFSSVRTIRALSAQYIAKTFRQRVFSNCGLLFRVWSDMITLNKWYFNKAQKLWQRASKVTHSAFCEAYHSMKDPS